MKTYVAMHYVGDYVPGEIIRDLPEESAARLLKTGAITHATEREAAVKDEGDEPEGTEPDETEPEETGEDAEEAEAEEAEEAEEETLEIDALDGVVAAPAEEPDKPARKKGAKTR